MRLIKFTGTVLLFAAVAIFTGCGAMNAQNTGTTYKPANATPDAEGNALMLKGYDVVSYFVDNKDARGSAQFRTNYQGIIFQFTSAEHKALFDKDSTRYLPEFGGYCADGIVYGIPWGGDGDTWKMIDGKLYIFGGQGSKDAFLLDEAGNLALAKKYWAEEVQGSNSIAQRTKRLIFRVPHYKSGEELAKAVAEAKVKH
ncbi:MAG: YHS domain-containing (seleno)protein [Betaproteobacteria bacterium]